MSVTVHDNTEQVLNELEKAYERALTRIGMAAERYAKEELSRPKEHSDGVVRPNVDTGLLRNSITFAISGKPANISTYKARKKKKGKKTVRTGEYSGTAPEDKDKAVYIGTNVEYAITVELGDSNSRAYPYLKPAATEHKDVYKRIFEDELKNG